MIQIDDTDIAEQYGEKYIEISDGVFALIIDEDNISDYLEVQH